MVAAAGAGELLAAAGKGGRGPPPLLNYPWLNAFAALQIDNMFTTLRHDSM